MTNLIPSQQKERIVSLDVVRGVAVLGILLMNIQSFSMINAAYMNPGAYGDLTGVHKMVWIISHVFADMKFLSIFSMLFGAGVILFTERAVAKGFKALPLHYKRMFWLLIFGLIHAYLFWHGDILVTYALCGLWIVLLRRKSVRTLLIVGLILFSVSSLIYALGSISLEYMPEESYREIHEMWLPDENAVGDEVNAFRGSWSERMKYRVKYSAEMQTFVFLVLFLWRAGGMMLIGMALYKSGVFSGLKSNKFYVRLIFLTLPTGLALSFVGVINNFQNNWSLDYSMYDGHQFNYWGSLFTSLGYVGILVLLSKSTYVIKIFQPVGKMAFSNYILQTLLCTLLFYGNGFALFGSVERLGQLIITVAIWITLIVASGIWLKYYRFGPLEWLWRSLTYQRLNLKKNNG